MTGRFHERFDIEVGADEARRRFINRAKSRIFQFLRDRVTLRPYVANALGEEYVPSLTIHSYVGSDFYKCLQAIEVCFDALQSEGVRRQLSALVRSVLEQSETDLGIRWENGKFVRSGARLLDQELVNEPLRWLADPKYENVRVPFEKGLTHFLNAERNPQLLSDVVTDVYEALETLSKIVTERADRDLSANRELFIKKVGASDQYKTILKDYIDYACEFRHGVSEGKTKPGLTQSEVESFVYLTGLFIRLAITRT